MGLGAKLNFAFVTVITIMVGSHVGVQIYAEHSVALQTAHEGVKAISDDLTKEASAVQTRNGQIADKLASDSTFAAAYAEGDRGAVSNAVKNFANRIGLPGFVTVFDANGKVFFSADVPAKYNYIQDTDIAEQVRTTVRSGQIWYGPGAPTASGVLCIVGMVPIKAGSNVTGALAVCEPINSPFLTGIREKIKLTSGVQNSEMLLYSLEDGRVTALTPGLVSNDNGLVSALNHEGVRVFGDKSQFDRGGRYWEIVFRFQDSHQKKLAYLLAGVPLAAITANYFWTGIEAIVSVVAALLIALMFSGAIGGRLDRSLRFLVNRAHDLAAQKQNLPPLDSVSPEFLELAEVIDTAVTSPRLSVKNLQSQMGKHQDELLERQKLVEEANTKVEHVNRQLTIQSRQLSEVSTQVNQANAQAVLLQQKLASVLQISTEGFIVLDAFGNVLAANPTFLNWVGCAEGEVSGRYCFDIVRKPGEGRDGGGAGHFAVHGGAPGDLVNQFFPEGIVYHRYDDKQTEVLAHLQPVMTDDHHIQGYIMVLRDKTLHSEASRLRNEIVSMLQDSIRTPLAVAEQKWNRLLATTKENGNSQIPNTLVDLHLSYQQLLAVVDSLLMMHTGIVPTTPVLHEQLSVSRLIGECMEHASQQARDHQVMLDFKTMSGLPTTGVDADLVRDAMVQLLEKMISITAPGGRVRVETSSRNNEIRTSIFSSGPALSPVDVEDMFVGFVSGKHPEDSYSQRLSLYLVRNNIERIGGRIWVESDRGTYIYVILPIQ